MTAISSLLTASRPKARATLIRLLGDMDTAEDALQAASLKALERWQNELPTNTVAWLVTVARNHFIDEQRKKQRESRIEDVADLQDPAGLSTINDQPIEDDALRLMFTCCHPALNTEAQVALTLKVVADLSTEEIARAFLTPRKTVEQRITRAKRKIRDAKIPFEIPQKKQLSERLSAVMSVIYLIFNEAYLTTDNKQIISVNLCHHAIRLCRWLVRLQPNQSEALGLLSLLLALHARFNARLNPQGRLLTLEEQDRSLWQKDMISQSKAILDKIVLDKIRDKSPAGPYQIQACIAVLHCQASSFEQTDWLQIELLYRLLKKQHPSPVITLNHIVAIHYAKGIDTAWQALLCLEAQNSLLHYVPFFSVKAHLLEQQHQYHEAKLYYEKALSLTQNSGEKSYLREKINQLNLSDC
jgi:RNA polymerase sigma-70 factor, ECF subfamily